MKKHNKLANHIFIGLSGGSDSLALLLWLTKRYNKPQLSAIHFNHGLRSESASEVEFCRTFCKKLNVSIKVIELHTLDHQRAGETIEMAARRLRQAEWKKLVKQGDVVALAHHKDDVCENFFMRLMRGASSAGLIGLRDFIEIDGVNYWRPLLQFTKAELIQQLQDDGVTEWCEDGSNQENIYRRNQVRNQLLPMFYEISGNRHGLDKSLELLQEENDFLEQQATDYLKKMENSPKFWKNIPPALLHRVSRIFLSNLFKELVIPPAAFIDRLRQELSEFKGGTVEIPVGEKRSIQLTAEGITLAQPKAVMPSALWDPRTETELEFGDYKLVASIEAQFSSGLVFDMDKLTFPLTVRTFKPGDRIKLFNGPNKKVKEIFINQKIPQSERSRIPIMVVNEDILALIGSRRSNIATCDDSTKTFLKISWKESRA